MALDWSDPPSQSGKRVIDRRVGGTEGIVIGRFDDQAIIKVLVGFKNNAGWDLDADMGQLYFGFPNTRQGCVSGWYYEPSELDELPPLTSGAPATPVFPPLVPEKLDGARFVLDIDGVKGTASRVRAGGPMKLPDCDHCTSYTGMKTPCLGGCR